MNGRLAGSALYAPYRVDIGHYARGDEETLESKVANRWMNRLTGDLQSGADKVTFTTIPAYRPKAPRLPGLIGPVRLLGMDES